MRIAVVVLIALGLTACSSGGSSSTPTLKVSAASSLTGAFTEMGKAFEATHSDASIIFNFGGSSALAEQIAQGADVDVFASADTAIMQEVVDDGTGAAASVDGLDVAGKTGTAETGRDGRNAAWFIGFAPASAPRYAFAVLVEDTAGTGGDVAAPIAASVLRALTGSSS
jgi:peptidoglycan glycosyltransferase